MAGERKIIVEFYLTYPPGEHGSEIHLASELQASLGPSGWVVRDDHAEGHGEVQVAAVADWLRNRLAPQGSEK